MSFFGILDFGITDIIDIILVATLLSYFYKLVRGTVAINIFIGIIIVYIIWKITEVLEMNLLSNILGNFIGVGFFALIVVFQEEIRKVLLLLGSSSFSKKKGLGRLFDFVNTKKALPDIKGLIETCKLFSKDRIGSLIVLERNTPLDFLEKSGDSMEIEFDSSILISFFQKESPLHDGAIIIRGDIIAATRVILPLTEKLNIPHRYGLRHRSAIGVTEKTDALALVTSEETGTISYARGGEFISFNSLENLEITIRKDLSE